MFLGNTELGQQIGVRMQLMLIIVRLLDAILGVILHIGAGIVLLELSNLHYTE